MITALLRRAARAVFADYRLNWVLRSPAVPPSLPLSPAMRVRALTASDRARLRTEPDPKLRNSAGQAAGARGFALDEAGALRCVAHYVALDGYTDAAIWPLYPNELALTDIVTRPADRGRGLAPLLIANATPSALAEAAAASAICFVWWNHHASLRAFDRAGWRWIGFSIEVTTKGGRTWRKRVPLAKA